MELKGLTIQGARSAIQNRSISATTLAEAHYAKIESDNPQIGAYLTLSKERALQKAANHAGQQMKSHR